jgi:hypothetical protein
MGKERENGSLEECRHYLLIRSKVTPQFDLFCHSGLSGIFLCFQKDSRFACGNDNLWGFTYDLLSNFCEGFRYGDTSEN